MPEKPGIFLNTGLLVLRVFTGAGMAYHGYTKIFINKMPGFIKYVGSLGFPAPEVFAWTAASSEFLGGLLLIIGLFTRPAALMVIGTMFVAAFIAHDGLPFKEKELPIAYGLIALSLMLTGGGKFSADNLLNLKIK